jgi:hypothetical protein
MILIANESTPGHAPADLLGGRDEALGPRVVLAVKLGDVGRPTPGLDNLILDKRGPFDQDLVDSRARRYFLEFTTISS